MDKQINKAAGSLAVADKAMDAVNAIREARKLFYVVDCDVDLVSAIERLCETAEQSMRSVYAIAAHDAYVRDQKIGESYE